MEPVTPFNEPAYGSTPERESWKDMAQNLYNDLNALWTKERELIRTELQEKVSEVKTATGAFVVAGAFIYIGVLTLAATAIIVLNLFTELWFSALVVTAFFLLTGFILLAAAKKKVETQRLKPTHSIEAFGEIKNTFQERFHELKKH